MLTEYKRSIFTLFKPGMLWDTINAVMEIGVLSVFY
jgi:hypothetical protein